MAFEHFEHKADVGVRGIGATLEEAFAECAKAMYEVMVDTSKVADSEMVEVSIKAADLDALLVEWLNALLYEGDVKGLFFGKFEVEQVGEENGEAVLKGVAIGEKQDEEKHEAKTEVKAATYSGMKVYEEGGKWIAQCIVDV